MARALKNPDADPTYLDFFGMTRPPFSQVAVPSQIFHSEQYSLLMAHLASTAKQADCLMVICGADGSGKTTLLNRYITSLSDDTSYATFDETCADGTEFYCAFLRQLGFHDITGKLQELRRITKEFLIHRGKAQDPVLLIMDNAHLVSPTVLEQLRWIAETKVDDRRVLSVVLAGNSDLPRIMDSPAMRLMKFRTQVDFNIRVYSEEETEDYVRHRLRLAGGVDAAKFSTEAHPLIYRFSGGIPSVINMLCNEVLAEASVQETRVISEELIRTVADRNRLLPNVFQLKGKGRRKTDPDYNIDVSEQPTEERITARAAPAKDANTAPGSASAVANAAKLNEQISRLQAQLVALKAENQKTQLEISARDGEIAELRDQLTLKAGEAEALSATAAEIDDLRHQLILKAQESEILSGAVTEIEDLRQQLAEKTREFEQLSATAGELKQMREQLAAKTEEATKLALIAGEIDDLREQLDTRTQEIEKLSAIAGEANNLREQLAAKNADSEQLSSTTAEADVLRKQLAMKTQEVDNLTSTAAENTAEIERLGKVVSENVEALAESEKQSKKLSGDLKKEKNAAKKALASVTRAEKRIEKLLGTRTELQQSVSDLSADLRHAQKKLDKLEPLENDTAALREEIEKSAAELQSREARVVELEALLRVALEECEAMRTGPEPVENFEELLSEKDLRIGILEAELASYSHLNTTTQPALDEDRTAFDEGREQPAAEVFDDERVDESCSTSVTSIEVLRNGQVEQVMTLANMPSRIMIGRGDDSELHLDSKFVSRHHALLFSSNDGLYIEDLNSFNGTVVNSKKILRCELHADDKVVVGDYELRPLLGRPGRH